MAKSSTNGSSRDTDSDTRELHSLSWRAKLIRLAQEHEEKAKAIRLTLSLMTETDKTAKRATHAQVLDAALAAEAARVVAPARTKHAGGRPRTNPIGAKKYYSKLLKQRQQTLKFLNQFGDTPLKVSDRRVGSLVRRGYLTNTGNGYLRTDKPYLVQPTEGA